MTIRKVTAFQAENGSLHTSERAALMASVAHHLGLDEGDEVESMVAQLLGIVPLLQRLSDPSIMAQGPKPQEPAPATAPAIVLEGAPAFDARIHTYHGQPVDDELPEPPVPLYPVTPRSAEDDTPGFEHPTLGRIELGERVLLGDHQDDYSLSGTVASMPNEEGWLRVAPDRVDELDEPTPQVIKPDAITAVQERRNG